MNLNGGEKGMLAWICIMSCWAFLAFGYDKWQAGRKQGRRVSETALCLLGALGGWPGGFLGLLLFRHKSAKVSFQVKYVAALVGWAALLVVLWPWAGRGN
jgi:uncharacterized membrane protein YsdA (DUF1294 family)